MSDLRRCVEITSRGRLEKQSSAGSVSSFFDVADDIVNGEVCLESMLVSCVVRASLRAAREIGSFFGRFVFLGRYDQNLT